MDRITEKDLAQQVATINRITGMAATPYSKRANGEGYTGNIGNYHLDGAYGGWKLVQMMNEHGGIHEITHGFVSKRELYNRLGAFIAGLQTAKS